MLHLVDGGWHEPEMLAEHAAEMRGARKAPRERHVGDGLAGLGLEFLAAMQQPCPPDVVADGHALVADVFNAHASFQVNKTVQIYGRVDNIFDNRYPTYGTFFDTGAVPNFTAGPATNFANGGVSFADARSLSPARPRAFYVGLKATF